MSGVVQTDLVPRISTGHVSKATAEQLDRGDHLNAWTIVAPYEHGWFLYAQPEDCRGDGTPTELCRIMDWAIRLGFNWIRLDADGDHIDDLESFDW
jgi:hypothetical protein